MNGYEIAILVLLFVNLLFSARDHGTAKEEFNNFWASALSVGITFGLLYGAGLFH